MRKKNLSYMHKKNILKKLPAKLKKSMTSHWKK